jgi:hypothetical protein
MLIYGDGIKCIPGKRNKRSNGLTKPGNIPECKTALAGIKKVPFLAALKNMIAELI